MRARILAMQATHGNQFVQQQLSGERPTSRPARPREAPASPTIARMFASTQMMGLDLAFPDVHLLPTGAWVPVPHPGIGAGPTSVTGVRTGAFTTMPDIPMPAIIGLAGPRVIASMWSGQIVGQLHAAASAMRTSPTVAYTLAMGVGGALSRLMGRSRGSLPERLVNQMAITSEKIRTATVMVEPFAGVTRTQDEVAAELLSAAADAIATGAAIDAVEAKAAAAAAAAAAEPPGRFVVGRGPGRVVPSQVRVFLLAPRRVDED